MNDSKTCSNGITKWLTVRSFAAFLLAVILSFSCVLASPSLTAYAAEISWLPKEEVFIDAGYENVQFFVDSNYGDEDTEGIYFINGADFYIVEDGTRAKVYVKGMIYHVTYDVVNHCLSGNVKGWDFSSAYTIACNYDIETFNSNKSAYYEDGTLFFRPASILTRTISGIQMNPLAQIVGLLPLLIPFLVGLAAFWKGLRFLFSLLRKA